MGFNDISAFKKRRKLPHDHTDDAVAVARKQQKKVSGFLKPLRGIPIRSDCKARTARLLKMLKDHSDRVGMPTPLGDFGDLHAQRGHRSQGMVALAEGHDGVPPAAST